MNQFGQYIRIKRVEAGISMRSLADRLGVSHVYLGMVERGKEKSLPEKYWEVLTATVPGIDRNRLEYLASTEQIEIDLSQASENEHRAAFALRRRIQDEQDLSKGELDEILRILGFSEKELFGD